MLWLLDEQRHRLAHGSTRRLAFPRRPAAMVPRVGVGGVGRDDVADPAEQTTRTNPQARRIDEPQDTSQEATIIELSNSRMIALKTAATPGSRIAASFFSRLHVLVLLLRTLADHDILAIGLQTYFGRDNFT